MLTSTILLPHGTLIHSIAQLVSEAFPGASLSASARRPDLAIMLGVDTPGSDAGRSIWLAATPSSGGFAGTPQPWSPSDSLAPLAAAGLVAGEAVRFAVRRLAPSSAAAASWFAPILASDYRVPAIVRDPIDVGPIDVVSGGAITHSMLFALAARGDVAGRLRVFDDGTYDMTNVNRYMLLRLSDFDAQKVLHLAALDLGAIHVEPVARRFTEQDLAGMRQRVIVGADDIGVRHLVQRGEPGWLLIGATSHGEVRITEHRPQEPCAGCAHPYLAPATDAPVPTIAPVSFWAGYQLAIRLLAEASGSPIAAGQRYATFWPLRPGASSNGPLQWHPHCPVDQGHWRNA